MKYLNVGWKVFLIYVLSVFGSVSFFSAQDFAACVQAAELCNDCQGFGEFDLDCGGDARSPYHRLQAKQPATASRRPHVSSWLGRWAKTALLAALLFTSPLTRVQGAMPGARAEVFGTSALAAPSTPGAPAEVPAGLGQRGASAMPAMPLPAKGLAKPQSAPAPLRCLDLKLPPHPSLASRRRHLQNFGVCTPTARTAAFGASLSLKAILRQQGPLQALQSGGVWRMFRVDSCGQPMARVNEPVVLLYTFSDLYLGLHEPTYGELASLPAEGQARVEAALALFAEVSGVIWRRASEAEAPYAQVHFRQVADAGDGVAGYAYAPEAGTRKTAVTFVGTRYLREPLVILHEVLHALGAKHPHMGYATLPSQQWRDQQFSSLLSYRSFPCQELRGLAPLDQLFLLSNYPRPPAAASSQLVLNDETPSQSFLLPENSTIVAVSRSRVWINAMNHAFAFSYIPGQDGERGHYLRWSPFTRPSHINITATAGGVVLGNDKDNDIYTGAGEAYIDGRQGSDRIWVMAGAPKTIVVPPLEEKRGEEVLAIYDFTPGHDVLAVGSQDLRGNVTFEAGAHRGEEGLYLSIPGCKRVFLAKLEPSAAELIAAIRTNASRLMPALQECETVTPWLPKSAEARQSQSSADDAEAGSVVDEDEPWPTLNYLEALDDTDAETPSADDRAEGEGGVLISGAAPTWQVQTSLTLAALTTAALLWAQALGVL